MLTITDKWLQETQLTEDELRRTLAVVLLRQQRITFEQARELSQMDTLDFLDLLKQHGVELEYGLDDLEHDIQTLRRLRQL